MPVEVHQPDPGASEPLVAVIQPLVAPFTTTGIVLIFVIFFLFQREDLRNRFIKLAGSGDLERTTSALDDAAHRLGRLFVTQLILNAIVGAIVGAGLALVGVPSAPLWGLLAMILRFVPYLGVLLAAVLPLAKTGRWCSGPRASLRWLNPSWDMCWSPTSAARVPAFRRWRLSWQLLSGHGYGDHLACYSLLPLTLCLVVVARHVDRLQFIDVMLGDQPALTPQQAAYQRMLAADPLEAIERPALI